MLARRSRGGRAIRAAIAVAVLLAAAVAQARDGFIVQDRRAPFDYTAELEPHLVFGSAPPGNGTGSGVGIGARASLVVAPDGFLRDVNDSVAIGLGLDYGHYAARYALNGYRDRCLHFEPGPAGTMVCTDVTSNGGSSNYLFVPAVMQWNFWPTEKLSAFGEAGLSLYYLGNDGFGLAPALYVGGRMRLTDLMTLTARIGYPTVSFGVSFMTTSMF
ncbi:MAG: hypothetical protein ABUS79_02885 [Pseudomonadota bacterium]